MNEELKTERMRFVESATRYAEALGEGGYSVAEAVLHAIEAGRAIERRESAARTAEEKSAPAEKKEE